MSTTKLTWNIEIAATKEKIWHVLLDDATYRQWTTPFCEGSYAVGDWSQGSKMLFLGPGGGDGMVSMVEVHRPNEYISIKHLGEVKGGVEDTTGEAAKAWGDAHENYALTGTDGAVTLTVELDCVDEYKSFMDEAWQKALVKVKELSEK